MDRATFKALHASGRLPSPEGVALQLLRLVQRESVSTREIADVIMADPALAGRVIASANSVMNYGHRPVVSVAQAIVVNGIAATCRLALSLSIVSSHQTGKCAGFDYTQFWLRSVVTALAMQGCAKRARIAAPMELFTLGLLSRIGVLSLTTLHPVKYAELIASAENGSPSVAIQREVFSTDENELCQYLLEEWNIPAPFREAIARASEEQPADGSLSTRPGKLADMLRVAWAMADTAADGNFAHIEAPQVQDAAMRNGLGPDDVYATWDSVADAWPGWGRILNLKVHPLLRRDATTPTVVVAEAPAAVPPVANEAGDALRVLALSRDRELRSMLGQFLAPPGAQLQFVVNDDETLQVGVTLQPQIIIIDWSGRPAGMLHLCQTLRQTAFGRAAYVLVVSSDGGEARTLEALRSGADEFLQLPVSAAVLEARLRVAGRLVSLKEEVQKDREIVRDHAVRLAVTNRKLEELAGSDPLTGLPNRRHAADAIVEAWRSTTSSGEPLACLMIDIDNFKAINDTYGHDVGDRVLARLACLLRANARVEDTVCRVGGDEFLVVCRRTDMESARASAERLRSTTAKAPMVVDGKTIPVSISVGVSAVDDDCNDTAALLKHADQALYRAKQRGRNRVEVD